MILRAESFAGNDDDVRFMQQSARYIGGGVQSAALEVMADVGIGIERAVRAAQVMPGIERNPLTI